MKLYISCSLLCVLSYDTKRRIQGVLLKTMKLYRKAGRIGRFKAVDPLHVNKDCHAHIQNV